MTKHLFLRLCEGRNFDQISELKVISQRCWNRHMSTSPCSDCQTACPEDAIQLGDYPEIDEKKCHACGLCVAACQPGAFIFPQLFSNRFLRAISASIETECRPENKKSLKSLVLTCQGVSEKEAGIPGPFLCLASLEAGHLIQFIFKGIEHLIIDCSHCKDCRNGKGVEYIQKRVEEARSWLQTMNIPGQMEVSSDPDLLRKEEKVAPIIQEPPMSRRHLFKLAYKTGLQKAVEQWEDPEEDPIEEDPTFTVPEKRRLLLKFFDQGDATIAPDLPGNLPILNVSANKNCVVCNECFVSCPGNALVQKEDRREANLIFYPLRCLGCMHCEELCPYHALETRKLEKDVFPLKSRVIFTTKKITCIFCEKPFIPKDHSNVCLPCRKHKEMDEEVLGLMNL